MRGAAVLAVLAAVLAAAACGDEPTAPGADAGSDAGRDAGAHDSSVDGCADCRGALRVMIPMADGVRLDTRVFVPGEGTVPTLLVRNPYRHAEDDEGIAAAAAFHNARGYAYVWQSVRGTSGSEGAFYPFVDEVSDGVATTAWIAAQPWSNGAIGTLGGSYLATTALAAAVDNPRVRVVLTDEGSVDERSSHRGGVVWGYLLDWIQLVETGGFFPGEGPYALVSNSLDLVSLDVATLGHEAAYWRDFVRELDDATFPATGSLEPVLERICTPAIHVYSPSTGWHDPIEIYRGMRERSCAERRDDQRLFVVTESHTTHFGALETEGTYVTEAMLAALDWTLLDGNDGLPPGPTVSYHAVGETAPREAPSWPPGSESTTLYLDAVPGEGPLTDAIPSAGSVALRSDPAGDACSRAGLLAPQWFTSAPATAPMRIAGGVELALYVRSDVPDFDLFAHLYDWDPSSDAYVPIASAFARARYRDGGAPRPLTEGAREALPLHFTHAAHTLAAGHALTFSLALRECGYASNPQTGEPADAQTTRRVGTIRIETGGAPASALVVPLAK